MAYLLLLPICLYFALAMMVLYRQPRGMSSLALAAYLIGAATVTGGYLVMGTTADRTTAEIAAITIVLVSSWGYVILLPSAMLGLYFESWFRSWWRVLLSVGMVIVLVVNGAMLWHMATSSGPLVHPLKTGFELHWILSRTAFSWPLTTAMLFASQIAVVIVTGTALYYQRLSLWRGAVPFTIASVLSFILPLLSPLAGERWGLTFAALGYALPVLLLTILVVRAMRVRSLQTLAESVLAEYCDGALLIDAHHKVLWRNAQVMRWLGARQPGAVTSPHLLEFLRSTPLAEIILDLLDTDATTGECELVLDGEEYVLQISLQPFGHPFDLPGAQLLIFRDITAARVRRSLAERSQELMALSAISAEIASSLEVDQVTERALHQILDATGAGITTVYLVDGTTPEQLKLAGSLSTSPEFNTQQGDIVSIADTTAGDVVRTRHPVLVPDTRQNPDEAARMEPYGMRAGASVPLIARDRVIGVLQVGFGTPHEFDAVEIALFGSLGQQLAIALDNARLHQQERQQRRIAEALREVASLLSSKTLSEALQAMLKQLAEIVDFDRAAVLLRAEPGKLNVRARAGFEADPGDEAIDQIRIEIAQYPYLLQLFTERAPRMVPDTTADADWIDTPYSHGSWIGVPLIIRDQVLGCLSLAHFQPGRFTQTDLQIASTFADQAVIAVENARLFENEQQRRVQAELLQQTSYDLVNSPDLGSALSSILTHLAKMLDFDCTNIGLIDDNSESWTPRASYGYPPAQIGEQLNITIPLTHYPLIQCIINEKRAILVSDTRQDSRWRSGRFSSDEIRCWIGAPLVARDRVIGVLNVDGFQPHCFGKEHLQIAQTFANQIAAAVENFRLFEEASRQNRALSTLNTILAASNEALTHDNLLNVSLERVLETLDLGGGAIHRYYAGAQELQLQVASGLPAAIVDPLRHLPLADTLPPITLPEGKTYDFFSVPLVAHGTQIGLLSVCRDHQTFSPEQQQLLTHIGQQLGVVMENANLFEEATRRGALSTDLGRLSLAISAQLDRDTVLDLLCGESVGIFDVQGAYIWLIKGEELVGTAAYGPGAERFREHSYPLSDHTLLPVRVIRDWYPQYVNRVADSTALSSDVVDMLQAQAVIAIPLLKADVPLGVLLLVNTQNPDAFADWLLDQVGLLGVQTALAIQNATLFDEIRRRLDQLRLVNEVGRFAQAILSPSSLIEGIAQKLFDILHYNTIGLLQVVNGDLTVRSIFANGQVVPAAQLPDYYVLPDSVVGQAIRRAEPVLKNRLCRLHLADDPDQMAFQCCSLAVPLILADEVIGALVVERRGYNSIIQDDLDVLEPLATQLAISVSNAQLFETVRQQTLELEARVVERTAEIREQHERTEAILRSVADAVIVFDLAGQVVMTNPVAKDLFEQHDLEMDLGKRIGALFTRTLYAASGIDADPPTEIIEVGNVILQAKAARVVEGDELLGLVVVLRDISRFQELDRMKDLFVSNVSHELRTPLTNLKLYVSLLRQGSPERQESYLEVMEREVERLARLIADLLDLSRLQSEQHTERQQIRETVNIETLIETVIHDHAAWAQSERQELHHECLSSPLPTIVGDPDQLIRAVTNLVANAITYTGPGGRVTVRSRVDFAKQTVTEWVIIEVIDTGIGIPAADLPMIFERFYRGSNVSPNIPGTGLGLAIIKEIVDLHGGEIAVESVEGQGSTFRLKLPVVKLEAIKRLSETERV